MCVVVYVGHYFDMKEHRQRLAQKAQQEAIEFDRLQEECFFQNKSKSCQALQKMNDKKRNDKNNDHKANSNIKQDTGNNTQSKN